MVDAQDGTSLLNLDISVLEPPSLIYKTLKSLAIYSIADMLAMDLDEASRHRGVGQGKLEALHELQARARELHALEPEDLLKLTTPDLLEELLVAQVDVDEPWEYVLRRLDARTRNALQRANIGSLRELVLRFESGTLHDVQGFGQAAHEHILGHLNTLIELGLEGYIWGEEGQPEVLDEAIGRVLESLEGQEHLLIVARFLQNKTLEKIGEQFGVSRERVRQRLDRAVGLIRLQWLDAFEAMLCELVEVLEDRGGLISKSVCMALTEQSQREHITFGLAILGIQARWCTTSHFLTTLQINQIESLFQQLRADIEHHDEVLTRAEHLEQIAHTRGWPAPAEEIVAFLENRWEVILLPEERLIAHPWTNWGELCAQVLVQHDQPATIDEITALFTTEYGLTATPSSRQIVLALSRNSDIHHIERGLYIHRRSLSLGGAQLDEIAALCIEAIQGVQHAVSTSSLLDELHRTTHPNLPEDISPLLLRDIMGRDPRVRLFQSTDMVAHLDSFEGKRQTQTELLDELLGEQLLPLDCEAICALIPTHISFHPNAIYATLREAPYVLNLGQGLFLHREAIGLTPRALVRMGNQAQEVLRDLNAPRSASRLLASLPDSPTSAYLQAHSHGAQVLFALLSQRDEVATGSGMLLGLDQMNLPGEDPALTVIVELVHTHEVLTASALRDLIDKHFGWDASTSALYHVVSRAIELGLVQRDEAQAGVLTLKSVPQS